MMMEWIGTCYEERYERGHDITATAGVWVFRHSRVRSGSARCFSGCKAGGNARVLDNLAVKKMNHIVFTFSYCTGAAPTLPCDTNFDRVFAYFTTQPYLQCGQSIRKLYPLLSIAFPLPHIL